VAGTVLVVVLLAVLASPVLAQETPTPSPSPEPTPKPTPEATASPSPEATASPSPEATTSPTPEATASPSQTAPTTVEQPASSQQPDQQDRRRPPRPRRRKPARHGFRAERRGDRSKVQLKRSCAPFSHTQTYLTWGPAWAYGTPVTVDYSAERCTKPRGTLVEVTTAGSATVYQGTTMDGAAIDRRPFRLTGRWDRPANAAGWPLSLWGCGVKLAQYRWEIPGVYTFEIGARWGVWSLTVSTEILGPQSQARDFHWSYDAC
jgi:hypothetical protein